jgi:hypothetical protein
MYDGINIINRTYSTLFVTYIYSEIRIQQKHKSKNQVHVQLLSPGFEEIKQRENVENKTKIVITVTLLQHLSTLHFSHSRINNQQTERKIDSSPFIHRAFFLKNDLVFAQMIN